MNTHRTVAAWLAAFGAFALAAPAGAQSDYGRSVYAAPPTPTASPPADDTPVTERFFEAEWTEPESIVEIPPGSLTAEDDPLPWRAEEIDGAMERERFEQVEFEPAIRMNRVGWSTALDFLVYSTNDNDYYYGDVYQATGAGVRLTATYENEQGSGIQYRLSHLGHSFSPRPRYSYFSTPTDSDLRDRVNYDQQLFAIDLTQRMEVGETSVAFGIGPRLARQQIQYKENPGYTDTRFDSSDLQVHAAGIGLGAGVERLIYRDEISEISLLGHARQSWYLGAADDGTGDTGETTFSIREIAGGVEWRREWGRGDLILQGMYELQESYVNRASRVAWTPSTNHGVALRIGYQW